ncbi:MAG: hypothetical protein AAFQ10_10405 [Pseudomonadota bacterium]
MVQAVELKDVEACLTRILTSSTFSGATGLQKFLSYVVRETLAGRGDGIKAYTIGVDALGKPQDFDPQADAAVRVMARRVRDGLGLYYAGEGLGDPVVIHIPVGSYRPDISYSQEGAKAGLSGPKAGGVDADPHSDDPLIADAAQGQGLVRPSLRKKPAFLALMGLALLALAGAFTWFVGQRDAHSDIAVNRIRVMVQAPDDVGSKGMGLPLVNDLAGALSRNKSFAVLQSRDDALDFIIRAGTVGVEKNDVGSSRRVSITLINAHTDTLVWSRNYEIAPTEIGPDSYDETIWAINRELLTQVFGAAVTALEGRDPQTLSAKQLFVLATWVPGPAKSNLAWETERVALARLALEKNPDFGPAHSVLADKLSYLAAVDGASDTRKAAREARASALRAIELSPGDVNVVFNVAQHYWHSGEVKTAMRWMERALEIDPSHAFARFFGIVLPYTCAPAPDYVLEEAVAFDASLAKDNPIRWVTQTWLGWLHLNRGELDLALRDEQRAASIFQIPYTIMRHAAVLNALGRTREAAELIKAKRSSWPNLNPRFFADVTMPRLCMNMDGGAEMLGYYRALANKTEPLLQ